jgi:8-oxo-dGTP pyrophosphatase MutT (NUDIX family)
MICNNCYKKGHYYKNCDQPLLSYGLCCFKKIDNNIKFLMVKRRNTYTYIEFLRGMYDIQDVDYLQKMFTKMSINEKKKILEKDFKTLWNDLWLIGNHNKNKNKNEFYKGIIKFNILKKSYLNDHNQEISLKYLIKNSEKKYKMEEWYFPKGKKEYLIDNIETNIQASLREFCEETNIDKNLIKIYEKKILEESHLGSNNKYYKTIFYLSEYLGDDLNDVINKFKNFKSSFQKTEIGNIKWIDISKLKNYFRDYEISKYELIENLEKIIEK